jgi:peptidoglycan/xylan/chitin deacetylase (PgdA/CDA1 family)
MTRVAAPWLRLSLVWHLLAIGLAVSRPSLWRLALEAVLLNHGLIAAACVWPRGRLLGPNMSRLPERYAARRQVGLTFDDGPDPSVTPRVAEILDRYSVTATFFCVGSRVQQHSNTVRDLVAGGHSIENHTHRHLLRFAFLGPAATAEEIDRAQCAIADSAGTVPSYFRAPAGIRGPWTQGLLERRGLRLVSWTRRGFDTVTRDPDVVVRRLTRGLVGGEILLLHDISTARDSAGEPLVLTALPRLLDQLAKSGLHAVALPRELLV